MRLNTNLNNNVDTTFLELMIEFNELKIAMLHGQNLLLKQRCDTKKILAAIQMLLAEQQELKHKIDKHDDILKSLVKAKALRP